MDKAVLSLGDTALTRSLIPATEQAALGSEGFIVRSRLSNGTLIIAADGNPMRYPTINATSVSERAFLLAGRLASVCECLTIFMCDVIDWCRT